MKNIQLFRLIESSTGQRSVQAMESSPDIESRRRELQRFTGACGQEVDTYKLSGK